MFSCSDNIVVNEPSPYNPENPNPPVPSSPPNILLIIADDVGIDPIIGYEEGAIKANTPNIESLINNGLTFMNFWAYPVCSPTRAAILTGKYGYRTGVLQPSDELPLAETSLQSYISTNSNTDYATAVIGKWHLSGNDRSFNPEVFGIDHFAGIITGGVNDYYDWALTEDGMNTNQQTYATTRITELAIDWVAAQEKPWFVWLAYNAAHTPFHLPPDEMHTQGALSNDPAEIENNPFPYYIASIEAMDYQIGKLLESLDDEIRENTLIIFIGDNGSPNKVSQAPFGRRRAKGTLYQGGIHCPLYVSGAGVSRRGEEEALVNVTDLFATISSLAGAKTDEIHDSKDFSGLLTTEGSGHREYVYAEAGDEDTGIDEWTIRNQSFKLMVDSEGNQRLFDLENDPYETLDLMESNLSTEAAEAKRLLEQELLRIRQ